MHFVYKKNDVYSFRQANFNISNPQFTLVGLSVFREIPAFFFHFTAAAFQSSCYIVLCVFLSRGLVESVEIEENLVMRATR